MTQYIAFGPMAGICNRIKRLFSALRFYGDSMIRLICIGQFLI